MFRRIYLYLKCDTEKCRARWDIIAIILPLIGTWLLVTVGVPEIIESFLTTEDGKILTTEAGKAFVVETDPRALAAYNRYFEYAIPALLLTTFGAIIQMRHSIAIIFGRQQINRSNNEGNSFMKILNMGKPATSFVVRQFKRSWFTAVVGLLLTVIGAGITASGVLISDKTATQIATPHYDLQADLKQALLDQSHTAAWGLALIAIGTVFQIVSVIQSELAARKNDE